MHPILLRPRRLDPLMDNPEPHPPDIELGEPVEAGGGKRHPVVRPDRARQPIGPKHALKDRPGPRPAASREARDSYWGRGLSGHHARMLGRRPPPPLRHQAVAGKQVIDRADRRPVDRRMPGLEIIQQLAGAPVGVLPPRGAQQLREVRRDPVGAGVGRAAPGGQARPAVLLKPVETLIAGLPANLVAGTQVRHGVEPTPVISDELQPLVHGVGLQPRHRSVSHRRVDRAV